jgi:oligo-1,6-glucosidase
MKKCLCLLIVVLAIVLIGKTQSSLVTKKGTDKKWWKEAIVYQIYPRSFKDSDGDGIGDLKGIISKLDYIKSLGVNAVWLNPIYSSPNDDNGYDVSDYRNIMKDFGTMADFDLLLKGLHERGIKLVMDFVLNHSSDEHEWFKQSKSSRTSPYRNYYHWWDGERVKPNYRYSLFDVNHDAWKYDSTTNAFYLHYFSKKQPDLNWENPQVRKEIYAIMKFWADKGIDGYRLDAFQFAAKDTSFPAFPKGFEKNFVPYYAMGPHLHDYLKEMNQEVFSKYDVITVAEGAGNNFQDAHDLVDADRNELNMAYAFDAIDMAKMEGYDFIKFKDAFSKWDSVFANKGWLSIFLASHDQARIVNRFGNASPEFRDQSSKMLTTFLLTMRGTPYIYNGDELAMTNAGFQKITDYRDMPTLNEYQFQLNHGGDINQFMKRIQFESRDNGRTPFQWDTSLNAGFSSGNPWIQVNNNYKSLNRAAQENDPHSVLNYFRKATALRHKYPALIYGKYTLLDKLNPDIYAYTRELDGNKFLVLLNFSNHQAKPNLELDMSKAKILLANYSKPTMNGSLAAYESIVYQLK